MYKATDIEKANVIPEIFSKCTKEQKGKLIAMIKTKLTNEQIEHVIPKIFHECINEHKNQLIKIMDDKLEGSNNARIIPKIFDSCDEQRNQLLEIISPSKGSFVGFLQDRDDYYGHGYNGYSD